MRQSVQLRTPYQIKELHGALSAIESVTLTNCETTIEEKLEIDAVIVNHGMKLDGCFLIDAGLELEADGFLRVSPCMETSQQGILLQVTLRAMQESFSLSQEHLLKAQRLLMAQNNT